MFLLRSSFPRLRYSLFWPSHVFGTGITVKCRIESKGREAEYRRCRVWRNHFSFEVFTSNKRKVHRNSVILLTPNGQSSSKLRTTLHSVESRNLWHVKYLLRRHEQSDTSHTSCFNLLCVISGLRNISFRYSSRNMFTLRGNFQCPLFPFTVHIE